MAYGCVYSEMPEYGHNNPKKHYGKAIRFLILLGAIVNFPYKQQIIRVSFWSCVTILFAAPLEVFHSLLEFFHLLFEWTEVSLDFIIEMVFDTTLHKTQVVVFYIIVAAILYVLYWLWTKSPAFYARQKKRLHDFLSDEIESIIVYWQESAMNKLKLSCAASVLIFLLFI